MGNPLRSLRVDDERWARYAAAAKDQGISRTEWMVRTCDAALEQGVLVSSGIVDARAKREAERAAMRGRTCPHGRPIGECLAPGCK